MKHLPLVIMIMLAIVPSAFADPPPIDPATTACASDGACYPIGDKVSASWGLSFGPTRTDGLLFDGASYGRKRDLTCASIFVYPLVAPPGSCSVVPGTLAIYIGSLHHEWSKRTFAALTVVHYVHAGVADWTAPTIDSYHPELNAPDCNPTGSYAEYLEVYPGLSGTGYIGTPDAPQGFKDACHLLTAEEAAASVAAHQAAQLLRDYGPAGVERTCAPVKGKFIRTVGAYCAPARDVIVRFLRGAAPGRGFVCRKMPKAATCSRAGGRRVTARW